jgi:tetratricopeptide (TPR) repeat protein
VLLAAIGRSEAGFYDIAKPTSPLLTAEGPRALPWELFRDELSDRLRLSDPIQPSKQRVKALERRDQLIALGAKATANDLAELGVLLWRLGEPDRALDALSRAKALDPRGFWPLVHLGTFYQATGQLHEADSHLGAALAGFASPWPAGAAAGNWFRKCEKAQIALLRSRLREGAPRGSARTRPPASVDALFPVQFAGPSGEYEAGTIAEAERAKLPEDAVATVQQLLLWFPEDARLLWLLGELYNATGDIRTAEQVFDECVGSRRFESPVLRDHRRAVKAAVAAIPGPVRESVLPDAATLWLVGGIGGAIVAIFVFLQVRELIRRRATAQSNARVQ